MKPLSSGPLAAWVLVLGLLAGCEAFKSAVPSSESPRSAPPSGKVAPAGSPWTRARVGDRLTYTFSGYRSSRFDENGGLGIEKRGLMVLEVVAMRQPWVWLKLSLTDAKGQPLENPKLARDMVLPVRAEVTRELSETPGGTATPERVEMAGRTWEARRLARDQRMSDGPREEFLYTAEPGPLYLTRGLLSASTRLSGFGGTSGSIALTLHEVHEGAEDAASSAPPSLDRPLGPGTWYEARSARSGAIERICLSAERGHVLRTAFPAGTSCGDFSQAQVLPLEKELFALVWTAVRHREQWPPAARPSCGAQPDPLRLNGRVVPSVSCELPTYEGKALTTHHAADLWDSALEGLAWEARVLPLRETGKAGPDMAHREPTLMGWGTWLEPKVKSGVK